MGPERAPDGRVPVAEGEDLLGLVQPDGGDEESPHPPLPGRVEGALALLRRHALEVAMGVDEAGKVARTHFARVPLGPWTSGWSSTGGSTSDADTSIPLDS